jgi:rod shape-determining protein MreD
MSTLRRNTLWAVAVIAAALLETTWLEAIRVWNVVPDLTLLMVIYFAITYGEERAMFTGIVGGIFQDVSTNAGLGHHILCHVVVGYAAARVASRLVTHHPAVKAGLVFCASAAYGILDIMVAYLQDPNYFVIYNVFARVVPASFYTAIFTPLLFFLLDRRFRPKPKELELSEGVI